MSNRTILTVLIGSGILALLAIILLLLFPDYFQLVGFAVLIIGIGAAGIYASAQRANPDAEPPPAAETAPASQAAPDQELMPPSVESPSNAPPDPKPASAEPVVPKPTPEPASVAPAAPQPAQRTYRSGDMIAGRYEVAGEPMMGGMGIVYICVDQQQDLPVALKTFKPEYLPDRAARDRFLREGTTWMDLGSHPHVARCYEVIRGDTGLEVYLALELIAKEQGREDASLRSWLFPGRPLPPEAALLFALQITRGMQHAAACIPGFIHRDLKPENVLVGADRLPDTTINRLRVTDFGLASVVQEAESRMQEAPAISDAASAMRHTQLTHGVVGTPLYMAPEQWAGEAVGVYTDVYALGCILYEMLTGYTAADSDSWEALEYAHRTGNLRPLPDTIPTPVRYILRCCLALDPVARYTDWDSVESGLASTYAAISGHAAPPTADAMTLSVEERIRAGWSYNTMGAAYLDISKAEVAASYFARALAIAREIGDRYGEGTALCNLGNATAALGDAQHAIEYYEQALAITREIGDQRSEGLVLNNLGVAYKNLGDMFHAIKYYEQALSINRELGDRWGEESNLGNLGVAYKNLGDARQAIKYYEQALAIAQELGNLIRVGTTLGNLGIAYKNLGDVQQAIKYYEQALVIRREIGDRHGEGNDLVNLGVAYGLLGDTHRDVSFTEQALAIWREIGNRRGEGIALGNLGAAYAALGDSHRAIEHLNQYLEIAREIGYRIGETTALGNLGFAYEIMGDVHLAHEFYSQALAIAHEIGDIDRVARYSFNISRLYARQGDLKEALPLAQEAVQIWTQIGSPSAPSAQQLVTEIQAQITADVNLLESFAPLIQAIAAAARGDRQAHAAVERSFPHIEQDGWNIVDPIRRIWAGERNEAILTTQMNHGHALIVREILRQLRG